MRRVTDEELAFYDRVAERISMLLGQPHCPLTQSSLAERIGWKRASLCNFINRIDKSIAAHFVPRIARTLQIPLEQLMIGKPSTEVERTSWDPRWDEPQVLLDKIAGWKRRKLPWISLRRILPAWVMPTRAMLVNYVDSILDSASPVAAERWHEFAESRQEGFAAADGGYSALKFGKTDKRVYCDLTPGDHPIELARYQVANCYLGRSPLINSGGASGENDFADALRTAVINKRAGGMGLISGRKAFGRPMAEGIKLLNLIQDVYLDQAITVA
jgi:hypothetical protein